LLWNELVKRAGNERIKRRETSIRKLKRNKTQKISKPRHHTSGNFTFGFPVMQSSSALRSHYLVISWDGSWDIDRPITIRYDDLGHIRMHHKIDLQEVQIPRLFNGFSQFTLSLAWIRIP
jgi:hypothetical protein